VIYFWERLETGDLHWRLTKNTWWCPSWREWRLHEEKRIYLNNYARIRLYKYHKNIPNFPLGGFRI